MIYVLLLIAIANSAVLVYLVFKGYDTAEKMEAWRRAVQGVASRRASAPIPSPGGEKTEDVEHNALMPIITSRMGRAHERSIALQKKWAAADKMKGNG